MGSGLARLVEGEIWTGGVEGDRRRGRGRWGNGKKTVMNAMNALMRELVEASRAYHAQMAASGIPARNNDPSQPGGLASAGLPQNASQGGAAGLHSSGGSREPHGIRELNSPLSE
jgi:hypothetical protein